MARTGEFIRPARHDAIWLSADQNDVAAERCSGPE